MFWLALHPPQLSLEAFCATLAPAQRLQAVALVAEHRVVSVNAAAAEAGVQPGLKRATALALVADLLLGQADATRDAQALQALVHVALAFTPSVTLHGRPGLPDTVLLEVHGSQRYFGGPAALLHKLRRALQPLGHRLQIASAPTALGAALLARWRDDLAIGPHSTQLPALQALLDDAPVWLLGPGREHWDALQGMGLYRMADLLQLPRSGLARRFGESLLDDLDRARGVQPDPRQWLSLPERFDSRLELQTRADHAEQVLHGAAVLLARLVAWALAQQARVAAFTLHMHHEARHRHDEGTPRASELRIELSEASVDAEHLQMLLRERLAHCLLLAPTLELQLCCNELQRSAAPNGELFPTRQGEREGLLRLLERLRARLGDEQVQHLQPQPDHRPEQGCRTGAALRHGVPQRPGPAGTAGPGEPSLALPLTRPVWQLPEALPLAERRQLPQLEGRPLQLLSGPERIETGWWDGQVAARDYFIAQDVDGSLVWIYRARLGEATEDGFHWFLQGRFA